MLSKHLLKFMETDNLPTTKCVLNSSSSLDFYVNNSLTM